MLVSFALLRHAGQCATNCNGDGSEHSHSEKRRVEGHRTVKTPKIVTPKELVSSNAWLTHAGHGKKTKEWDGREAYSYTDGMDSPAAHQHKEKMC